MAEVAISYAHDDVDLALALRHHLEDSGRSVWIDDIGIPVGTRHWDVIQQEFGIARVIVAVDTPTWRTKEYCMREYALCLDLGKWLIFWKEENSDGLIAEIATALRENHDELAAHARVASRAISEQRADKRWRRLFFGQRARDAERLLAGDLLFVKLTPRIQEITKNDLYESAKMRRLIRNTGILVLIVLAALFCASLLGKMLATRFAADAEKSSRIARSADLINRSQEDVDSMRAIAAAKKAEDLDPNDESRAAVDAAILRDNRLRTIELPPGDYVGASWASDAPVVIAYTRESSLTINTATGSISELFDVVEGITGNLLVAGPDGKTAIFVDSSGALVFLDLKDGTTVPLGPTGVRALAVGTDGMLVWGTSNSTLHMAPYPLEARLIMRAAVATPAIPRAMDLDAETKQLALVDQAGWLRFYDTSGNSLTEQTVARLSDLELTEVSALRASITLCGARTYGSFTPNVRGTAFRIVDDKLVTQRAVTQTPALCTQDDALWMPFARGAPEYAVTGTQVVVPEELTRFVSVRDPQHRRISILSPSPARLLIVQEDTVVTRTEAGAITRVVPLSERVLGTTNGGDLVDVSTGDTLGKLSGVPITNGLAVLGCDAVLIDPGHITHVDCDGNVTRIIPTPEDIRGVRTAADGEHFVVCFASRVAILDKAGRQTAELSFDWLSRPVVLIDADLSPDGSTLALSDSLGRVHLVDVNDPHGWSTADVMAPAGSTHSLAYLPDGDLLTLGPDGVGRRYNPDLRLVDARQLSPKPAKLLVSGDRVYAKALATRVFDCATLSLVEQITRADLVPNRLTPQQDVVGVLRVGLNTDKYRGYLIRVPRLK